MRNCSDRTIATTGAMSTRYYDEKHKDYQEWNDRESRAYRMYWQQCHHNYIDWERANERQRRDYWSWHHSHSNSVLQINIR
jgi:hypothetical protein